MSIGAAFVWTAPTLETLKIDDANMNPLGHPITVYEESLIASLHSLGLAIGAPLFGKLSDIFGRKKTLLCSALLELIGFIILAFSNHVFYYYFSRSVQGLCLAFTTAILPVYLAEIAEDSNRGIFCTFVSLFSTLGNVYAFGIATFFEIKMFTLFCGLPIVLNIILFTLFVPESPFYLVMKQKTIEAKESFSKFHNLCPEEVEIVLKEIQCQTQQTNLKNEPFSLANLLKIRKPLCICCGIFIFQQFSGLFAVLGYFGSILSLAKLPISGSVLSICVASIQLIPGIISSMLIEKLGRRILLLLSSLMIVVSLFLLGLYFFLESSNFTNLSQLTWLPITAMIIFIIGFGIGLGPISFVLIGEVFPTDFKTLGASISIFSCGVTNFILIFAFPLFRDILGLHWCFWILNIISLVGFVFIYFYVPETKGKSFAEIQKMMKSEK